MNPTTMRNYNFDFIHKTAWANSTSEKSARQILNREIKKIKTEYIWEFWINKELSTPTRKVFDMVKRGRVF